MTYGITPQAQQVVKAYIIGECIHLFSFSDVLQIVVFIIPHTVRANGAQLLIQSLYEIPTDSARPFPAAHFNNAFSKQYTCRATYNDGLTLFLCRQGTREGMLSVAFI